CTRGGDVDYW
nr:immunoglobulin heavy chain junction region [Mus musculus]MBK4183888.1 immunoglobulin heavy chain junction region [Mus musculus]